MDQLTWLFHQLLDLHRQIHRDLSAQMSGLADGNGAFISVATLAFCLGMVHALTPGHGKVVLFAYFLGRKARPWAGLLAAAQIACLHVGTAIVLVLAIGGAAYVLGRPTGIAFILQVISALAVTAAGAWYLKRAIGGSRPSVAAHSHTGIATAVGLLPCPLTMLVLSAAFADATLGIGLMLVAVMGLGIMVTIGLAGSVGVAAQRGLSAGFGGEAPTRYSAVLRCLEVGSSAAILFIGLSSLAAL